MAQDFKLVVNKRSRRVPTKQTQQAAGSFLYSNVPSKTSTTKKSKQKVKDEFSTTFNTARSRIESCTYYSGICAVLSNYLESNCACDLICYGIGNVYTSRQSYHQLALITLLHKYLKLSGDVCIFDPVLTEEEVGFLNGLGYRIITENEEGKRKATNKTIFYMPHCTKQMYSNVLWANWSASQLTNICILGNSFSHYNQRMIQKPKNMQFDYVDRITPHTTEVKLVGESPMEEAFNDMNFHFFEASNLQDAKLWKDCPEPPAFSLLNDPELIAASSASKDSYK